jgi:hypothetical protein
MEQSVTDYCDFLHQRLSCSSPLILNVSGYTPPQSMASRIRLSYHLLKLHFSFKGDVMPPILPTLAQDLVAHHPNRAFSFPLSTSQCENCRGRFTYPYIPLRLLVSVTLLLKRPGRILRRFSGWCSCSAPAPLY